MKKNNLKIFLFALLTILIFDLQKTFAVCPICTVAIGAGVGFTRYIGIDDTITGLWIGGFIVSSGLWLASFLKNKNTLYRNSISYFNGCFYNNCFILI